MAARKIALFAAVMGMALNVLTAAQTADSTVARWIEQGYWSARSGSSLPDDIQGSLFHLRAIEIKDDRGRAPDGFSAREFAGEAASRANLEALQTAVRRYYLNHGFPFAELTARVRADSSGLNQVDVELRVVRGAAFKRGDARLLETRTRPETVQRMALWDNDEDFSQERTEKGLERLRRSGYFESADWVGLYRDPDRNVLYPLLRLPDAHANTIGGLLGYDSKAEGGGKLTGYLDIRLVNLFGTARDFDFTFEDRTGSEREITGAYVEPWLFSLPVGARLEGSFLQQDTLFWEWNQGLTFFRDLSFISRLEVAFGAQANHENTGDNTTPDNGVANSNALRSGVRLLFDARDGALFTRSGYRSNVAATGVRRTFENSARDSSYFLLQAEASFETWIPVSQRVGIRLAARSASNFPLNRLNHGELYYVGGARSLRGYREREFATNAYLLGESELQYWVGRRGSLFAFASPGVVNRLVGRYDGRGVLGYGFGIEQAQGDWSLSLAYALNPERRFGNGLLHVAVENRF